MKALGATGGFRRRGGFVACALVLLATGCGGGGSDEGGATTGDPDASVEQATEEPAEDEADSEPGSGGLPSDGPPLLAASVQPNFLEGDGGNRAGAPGGGPPRTAGPGLPAAWMPDPAGATRVLPLLSDDDEATDAWMSPDATLIAYLVPGEGGEDDRFDFVSTSTGDVIDTIEGANDAGVPVWSPDSRAFAFSQYPSRVVHRIEGQTATAETPDARTFAFASDASATEWVSCGRDDVRLVATDGDGDGEVRSAGAACGSIAQLYDEDGMPVALLSNERADGTQELVMIRSREAPAAITVPASIATGANDDGYALQGCGTLAVVRTESGSAILESISGSMVATPELDGVLDLSVVNGQACPIASPDHGRAAFRANAGEIVVVDFDTGSTAAVRSSGQPVAFGESGDTLLVDGDGTELVTIESIEDAEAEIASVQAVAPDGIGSSYCRAGQTGLVLVRTEAGVVVYDVDADESYETPGFGLPVTCSLADGDRWLVSGTLLVDLDERNSWVLPAIGMPEGDRLRENDFAPGQVSEYSFAGPQWRVLGLTNIETNDPWN